MTALANKTVLLVTHQVDFLPTFDRVMVIISIFEVEGHGNYYSLFFMIM